MRGATAPVEQSVPGRMFGRIATIFFSLLFALFLGVVIEWVGMTYWWPEERLTHAEKMYAKEIDYLQADFKKTFLTTDTVAYSKEYADKAYYYIFEATRLTKWIDWLATPAAKDDKGIQASLNRVYLPAKDYFYAGRYRVLTYFVRLSILTLALPLFVLVAIIGITDGLVRRDVRRWSGGRESSLIFSASKGLVMPLLVGPWVIYLAYPFSIHPNFIILPFAIMFSVALAIMISAFKKYL